MDIEIICSKCKDVLQLSPEPYLNDGVERWSTEPHTCEAAEQSLHQTKAIRCACGGEMLANYRCQNCGIAQPL